jgi:hypothetical protein
MSRINVEEVLWIGPDEWRLPGRPSGYPMHVIEAKESTDDGRQYVRGRVLTDAGQPTGDTWLVLLPVDQPRAVFQPRQGRYRAPDSPTRAVGRVPAPDNQPRVHPPVSPQADYRAAAEAYLDRRPRHTADNSELQSYHRNVW